MSSSEIIQKYIDQVQGKWQTGVAREHAYRPALEELINEILPGLTALNDPARIHVGALDFIIRRGEIDVGYIEAKDLNINLDKVEKTEQLQRYLDLDNLILTDYLEFRFYREGEKVDAVRIGDPLMGQIYPRSENFDKLKTLLEEFGAFKGQTIRSAEKLAEMMARKARLMREVFNGALTGKEESSLKDQCKAFKDVLMHDLDEAQFADIYAQTITYGLFTARLHDPTPEDFTRSEAQGLIPKSNPFLRQLFHYVTGPELDTRVVWIIDDLCSFFQATNVRKIFEDYGKNTRQTDPVLHFYETFLGAYDKSIKDMRGVWFTPEPVVQFIVQAIDELLRTYFNIERGIADNNKIEISIDSDRVSKRTGKREQDTIEVHRVQLLDVATGTGTFLAEAIKKIYLSFKGIEGVWGNYVEKDLLPRIHGFELLMASYAMCHMKIDLLLSEMGYLPSDTESPTRLSVYLTNTLEEHHPDADTLLASWLSREANEASRIKRDMPIMVAFGNPPYSGESANKGDYIMKLMEDYKKEPGSNSKLKERNSKWINDDYVKFIRLGEHYIQKNGEGILAYITNHSYLDNPTFRGMRWHLLNTFDDIYILDLHGNSLKKEKAPDGSADSNVFDIRQGVSIILALKKKRRGRKPLAKVFHSELFGKRADKYKILSESSIDSLDWNILDLKSPHYFFVPKDYKKLSEYQKGFSLRELFSLNTVGIVTARDSLTIHEDKEDLLATIHDFTDLLPDEARSKYNLGKDVQDWSVERAQQDLNKSKLSHKNIHQISYRPFDNRWTYYTGQSKGFHCRPRADVMQHLIIGDNISLNVSKQQKSSDFRHVFCHRGIAESSLVSNKTSEISYVFPLYRYETMMNNVEQKVPNLNSKIFNRIREIIPEVTPEQLFDYIYAVLHAPTYRKRYAELLKSDFPYITYPTDSENFYNLVELGGDLRQLHLLEHPMLFSSTISFPIAGECEVEKPIYKGGRVYINENQYFESVPEGAWEFFIGSYQPAQKWLKDRVGKKLSYGDIKHWQKIIVSLDKTVETMKRIDAVFSI